MQITREASIELDSGKKEKVRVTFDIPGSIIKTKEEITEEFGDIGMEDITPEQIIEETYGSIANSLSCYISASLHCGYNSGSALALLQESIKDCGMELVKNMKIWKENEKMS